MIIYLITVAFSLALNFLIVSGHEKLIEEAELLGSVTAKTMNSYPMVMTAFSVIFPLLSNIMIVLYIFFLRKWVPYARERAEKDS